MKAIIFFIVLSVYLCADPLRFIGKCGVAPKYRPVDCYKNSVLPEDMKELEEIISKFKNGGDDNEFVNLIGDLFDKKKFRKKKKKNLKVDTKRMGSCGMHPRYLPVNCYEENVLRRDRKKLREIYDKYHGSDLKAFNEMYKELVNKKFKYYIS